ncbi:MAG: aminodeoxychorismate lyase [Spongiibacteraceae bacterium]|nr:aminodeoxychorismate lyase [Spongiibacteraceae bacterium]
MFKWLKRLLPLSLVFVTLAALVVLWADQQLTRPLNVAGDEYLLDLKPGTGFSSMARSLAADQLIDYPVELLSVYARFAGYAGAIQSGEYRLRPGLNSYDLLALLVSGEVVRYRATLIEGWTFADLTAYLAAHPDLDKRFDSNAPVWAQLGIDEPLHENPEGLFFPDTYSFVKGATDIGIMKRAYRRMLSVLDEEWAGRSEGLPFTDPYEALILASIVEKETGQPHERERIAGVFVSRLQKNMRLQTDPTVIYGLPQVERKNLRSRHLADASNPYNTYRRKGLPPTPIAMPGRAAIHAALHPLQDGALFFVAKGDGSHQFSETLEQHQQAVRDYQLQRRKDYRSSPAKQ